jgi:hypothetical protein
VTDVYSGYGKALKTVNLSRQLQKQLPIESGYCNAHARRYFYKPRLNYPEANFYLGIPGFLWEAERSELKYA